MFVKGNGSEIAPTRALWNSELDVGELTVGSSTIDPAFHLLHFSPTTARQSTHIASALTMTEFEELWLGILCSRGILTSW